MNTKLAHIDDPDVSHVAAINLSGTATEKVMHAVIDLLIESGPQTPAELERIYQSRRMINDWPIVAMYSVRKRVSQMKKQVKVVYGTGERDGSGERVMFAGESLNAHARITAYMRRDEGSDE